MKNRSRHPTHTRLCANGTGSARTGSIGVRLDGRERVAQGEFACVGQTVQNARVVLVVLKHNVLSVTCETTLQIFHLFPDYTLQTGNKLPTVTSN